MSEEQKESTIEYAVKVNVNELNKRSGYFLLQKSEAGRIQGTVTPYVFQSSSWGDKQIADYFAEVLSGKGYDTEVEEVDWDALENQLRAKLMDTTTDDNI